MGRHAPGRVAVVGGGPGGAQCARRLAEAGAEVTIFEPRERFEKACGGGIPVRGMERFPFLFDRRMRGKEIRDCLLVAPSGREARFRLDDPLFVFSRADLHALLLDRALEAGARLVRARVVGFEKNTSGRWAVRVAGGAHAEPRAPFDFLVAADGAAGACRRRLLGGAVGAAPSQGIGCYLPDVSESFVTLKFYGDLHGYLWVFPRPDHSSAGICATLGARPAAGLKRLMEEFLRFRYPEDALAHATPYAALIPSAPRRPGEEPLAGPGWGLVGDAAHLVDPLTREGIYYAMLSGDLLAQSLAAGRPEAYEEAWAREAGPELSWAAAHGDGFFDGRFVEKVVRLSSASPAVARVLSDLMAGRQSYRTLKPRLLLNAPLVAAHLARRALAGPLRSLRGS